MALIGTVTIPAALPAEANPLGTPKAIQIATPPPAGSGVAFEVVPAQPSGSPTPAPRPSGSPTPAPRPSGDLPATGTESVSAWFVILGLLLVLGGALITAAARRRVDRPGA